VFPGYDKTTGIGVEYSWTFMSLERVSICAESDGLRVSAQSLQTYRIIGGSLFKLTIYTNHVCCTISVFNLFRIL
jgi:hypothetical protein